MALPILQLKSYDDACSYYTTPEEEYQSLINDVTLWDVAAERQIEIIGEDTKFVQYMTPRNHQL